MDEILLSFNEGQYKKYLELLQAEDPKLPSGAPLLPEDVSTPYGKDAIKDILEKAQDAAIRLLSLEKRGSFFASSYSQAEIKEIREIYFCEVRELSSLNDALLSHSLNILKRIERADSALLDASAAYNEFLPYRAALSEREELSEEVGRLDAEHKSALERATALKAAELELFNVLRQVCDTMISDFLRSSARAADSPSFERFSPNEFFACTRALSEQLKAIKISIE